jgi:hypothetical protein
MINPPILSKEQERQISRWFRGLNGVGIAITVASLAALGNAWWRGPSPVSIFTVIGSMVAALYRLVPETPVFIRKLREQNPGKLAAIKSNYLSTPQILKRAPFYLPSVALLVVAIVANHGLFVHLFWPR